MMQDLSTYRAWVKALHAICVANAYLLTTLSEAVFYFECDYSPEEAFAFLISNS